MLLTATVLERLETECQRHTLQLAGMRAEVGHIHYDQHELDGSAAALRSIGLDLSRAHDVEPRFFDRAWLEGLALVWAEEAGVGRARRNLLPPRGARYASAYSAIYHEYLSLLRNFLDNNSIM